MTKQTTKNNVNVFNKDVENNKGYLYTHSERLSAQFSYKRMTQGIANIVDIKNKTAKHATTTTPIII